MIVIGREATTPERLIRRVFLRGVPKNNQTINKEHIQPATPAISAAVLRQTSKINIRMIGSRERRMEKNFMAAPIQGLDFGACDFILIWKFFLGDSSRGGFRGDRNHNPGILPPGLGLGDTTEFYLRFIFIDYINQRVDLSILEFYANIMKIII